jgi:hypothetical protein
MVFGALGGTVLASIGVARMMAADTTRFLSAADDDKGGHCLLGIRADGGLNYCLPVPYRAHEACALNDRLAIYFARRPGRQCYVVDMRHGELVSTLNAADGEHFCGHGCVSQDGRYMFLTAYAYERHMGVVAVHETAPPFRKLTQFDTHGLDPHQAALLPDSNTLVVANGGILTHPDSQREMLNLDTMAPSLVYLRVQSGELVDQQRPPHHQISLRHLAINSVGTVIIGAQDHTPGMEANPHPLVFQHQLGSDLQELTATSQDWRRMNQYIASVALSPDGNRVLTTTPRGNLISLWDLADNRLIDHFNVRDVAGATWVHDENRFLVSNGVGQLVYLRLTPELRLELAAHVPGLHWDNHLGLV